MIIRAALPSWLTSITRRELHDPSTRRVDGSLSSGRGAVAAKEGGSCQRFGRSTSRGTTDSHENAADASPRRPSSLCSIHGYTERRLACPLADDITLETFLIAFGRRDSYDL